MKDFDNESKRRQKKPTTNYAKDTHRAFCDRYKTMLRQLISKWGIMSIDMASAIDADMAVINEDGTKDYVDNDPDVIVMEQPSEPEQATSAQNDIQAALFGGEDK